MQKLNHTVAGEETFRREADREQAWEEGANSSGQMLIVQNISLEV